MKRVIFKVKLKNREIAEEKLDREGVDLSAIFWLHDRVYVPRGYERGKNYPRLVMRTEMRAVDEPPKYILILRRHIEDSGIDVVEKTVVLDYVAAVNMILQLGFRPAGEVSRRRQNAIFRETYVCFDEIDGKEGSFMKVEGGILEKETVEEVRTRILGLTEELIGGKIENAGEVIEKPYSEM